MMPRFFLRHRLVLTLLLVSTLIAAVCAKVNTRGDLQVAAATTHVFVDTPDASIINRNALTQDLTALQKQAQLYGDMLTTQPVLEAVAKRAGIPASQLSGVADVTGDVPVQFTQAGSEKHAAQLIDSEAPYRLEMQPDVREPLLTVYAEAPTLDQALKLANATITGLDDYLRTQAVAQGFPIREVPQLRQLGSARGGITNAHAKYEIAGLTFITAFALSYLVLLILVRRPWRRREDDEQPPPQSRATGRAAANWPHTTRILPWSVAGLIAMFWLTPFDRIQLSASGPINITLDRIILPLVFVVWLIATTAGPGAAPRMKVTRVHIAVGVYVACAFLSTVLDAHYLNHVGELTLSVKRIPYFISYISVFVLVASAIRPGEVPAFMKFTLILAVVVGVGVIYEYRFHQNLFTMIANKVFIGPFTLVGGDTTVSAVDSLGRRTVEGPAAYGVELVTMLSMALPIGILGIIKSRTRKQYTLYGLASGVLLYAMMTTDRKSALVAPAAAFLTLAYFRRRQLLSLAPLGLILVVFLAATSPTAIRNIITQYTSADAGHVATVSSRTANYDAIRPDLWGHLLLGRGEGTYAPPTDRIVDSEIILPLAETGVLGLVAFLMIPGSLILYARRAAYNHELDESSIGVWGVSAGVVFLSVSTLYSVMSLPHGPDVFFYVAGLAVAGLGTDRVVFPAKRRRLPPNLVLRGRGAAHRAAAPATRTRGVTAG